MLETVERLGEAVRTELTTLEEVLTQRTELVAATRGARRQAEAVTQQLQGLAFWQGVPLSPLQVAEDVSFVEEYRWVALFLPCVAGLSQPGCIGQCLETRWIVTPEGGDAPGICSISYSEEDGPHSKEDPPQVSTG